MCTVLLPSGDNPIAVNKYIKSGMVERFRSRHKILIVTAELQTANVAYYCQRKIQLSGFSAYPDGLPSQLIRLSVVQLYWEKNLSRCNFGPGLQPGLHSIGLGTSCILSIETVYKFFVYHKLYYI